MAIALSPLSLVFLCIAKNRRMRTVPTRLPVPVVVVGNIYVGGTGKTPVTIALVRELIRRGYRPGVVSRGFGRKEDGAQLVKPTSPAQKVGDEPLLIAKETGVPVYLGYFDWGTKHVGRGEKIELTDDAKADMKRIQEIYESMHLTGKFPENYITH